MTQKINRQRQKTEQLVKEISKELPGEVHIVSRREISNGFLKGMIQFQYGSTQEESDEGFSQMMQSLKKNKKAKRKKK